MPAATAPPFDSTLWREILPDTFLFSDPDDAQIPDLRGCVITGRVRYNVDGSIAQHRRPLTPWELPGLLTPVHTYRQASKKAKTERKHFAAILGFVYRNRFAVASQIQRRFSDVLRSDRTTRRHLEELEALGYLAVAPARGVSPLFPKVYYVTGRGVRKLGESLNA